MVIDRNGFPLQGPSTCSPQKPCAPAGTARGVDAEAGPSTTVRNGVVRGFLGGGLSLGTRARVEAVTAFGNGFSGIQVSDGGIVTGCTAASNVGHGIQTGQSATIDGNTANDNGQNGIQTSLASVISRDTTFANNIGIVAGSTSIVVSNSARANDSVGIVCNGCMLIGDSALGNNGVDLGQNICGAPELGNGIVCP